MNDVFIMPIQPRCRVTETLDQVLVVNLYARKIVTGETQIFVQISTHEAMYPSDGAPNALCTDRLSDS